MEIAQERFGGFPRVLWGESHNLSIWDGVDGHIALFTTELYKIAEKTYEKPRLFHKNTIDTSLMAAVERQLRKGNVLNYKNPIKLDKTLTNIKRVTLRIAALFQRLYTACYKAVRRIYKISLRSHRKFVYEITDDPPIDFQIHRRFIKFVHSLLGNKNQIVNMCVKLAMEGSCSPLCNNISLVCFRY